jgi:Uma2 family endonuclease
MVATAATEKIYSAAEYFEIDKRSDERFEFYYGKLLPISGESIDANRIGGNCYDFFKALLDENRYDIFRLAIKLRVVEGKIFRYPDVMVVPTASIVHSHEIKTPELIVEITSEESSDRDRKTKLKEYTEQFPTLQYYLIIDQYEPSVVCYSRKGEDWLYSAYDTLDQEVPLDYFQSALPLGQIYKKVKFGEPKTD